MKKLSAFILVLMLVLTMTFALVSCNNGGDSTDGGENETPDEKINYTVTVLDADGAPVAGVVVTVKTESGMVVPYTTKGEGTVTHKSDSEITAAVTSIPGGYTYDELGVYQNFDKDGKLTVNLEKIPPYVVTVVDEDGTPVSGVNIKVCDDNNLCLKPSTTDESGKATFDYVEGDFHAMINGIDGLPEGVTVDDINEIYYFDSDGTVTITVKKSAN